MADPCDPQELMNGSACYSCLSEQQLLAIQVWLLCQFTDMDCSDPQSLMTEAKCFMCFTQPQLSAIVVYLLCMIYSGGGGGGGVGSVQCGIVNPTVAPATSCAFYYRTDNGAVWFWNGAAWVALIAP